NCGAEGPTDDPGVLALRARQRRNLLATLLLSQGMPMILGGDELGRTQAGNNNAYCQDGPLSWVDWDAGARERELTDFVARLCRPGRRPPVSGRRQFLRGASAAEGERADVGWFRPDGQPMAGSDWGAGYARAIVMGLSGVIEEGAPPDDPFLLM